MICHENFVTYEARLASFTNPKKRATTANGRAGKIMRWPHSSIRPEDMALAGMFFSPTTTNPDHTICFHCGKGLDGWEDGDNPFDEHLTHSRSCGWAILKAAEYGIDGYDQLDPLDPGLVAARKETFENVWPHDDKKGWKCKTKQLVESGWVYTPTLDSIDMATCLYCSLALDGWEPGDKPLNEHESRSANCPIILALKSRKRSRGKNSTAANNSLLSLQSNATYMSEQPPIDMTAEPEDSVMTTTSTTSKKPTRTKKTTTSKGRKTKVKKEESLEPESMDVEHASEIDQESMQYDHEPKPMPAPPPASRKRVTPAVNKRTSEAMEDSAMMEAEAPAPKKKTRGRAVSPAASIISEDESLMQPTTTVKKKKAAPRQSTRSSRGGDSSNVSFMSAISTTQSQSMLDGIPSDEEIDKQLEADLERFTDHEDLSADSDSERRSRSRAGNHQTDTSIKSRKPKSPTLDVPTSNYAMFDPSPTVSEQDVEDEMQAMEVEMRASRATKIDVKRRPDPEQEPEPEPEPQSMASKKGRKAPVPRKVSKSKSVKSTSTSETSLVESVIAPGEQAVLPERPAASSKSHLEEDELATNIHGKSTMAFESAPIVSAASKKSKAKQPAKSNPTSGIPEMSHNDSVESQLTRKKPTVAKEAAATKKKAAEKASMDDVPPPPPPHASLKSTSRQRKLKEPEPEPELIEEDHEQQDHDSDVESEANPEEREREPTRSIYQKVRSPPRSPTPSSIPKLQMRSPRQAQPEQPHAPSTPTGLRSSPVVRHAVAISPSQSPHASDTEAHTPSSISGVLNMPLKKVVLVPHPAPVAGAGDATSTYHAEGILGSPGKRTVMTNIRTASTPWASIDVDQVFDEFTSQVQGGVGHSSTEAGGGEGHDGVSAAVSAASAATWVDLLHADQLSGQEKEMTVEQWIYHNAAMAEKKMRHECEAMVSRFESEGSKAMRVLEGLVTE
ncbi:hypothetical protein BROUX41_005878 [Berkeleyomyces rouxiae]|uniref:uncharacterized protein n=1 Tax=Berkeleyomyces rouxiae TaxID=2035830 RepID=UPI003B77E192